MRDQTENTGNRKTMRLFEELTIKNADRLTTTLGEMLDTPNCVVINTESVTEIDLSCLQLFCAAHRTSIGKNKQIVIEQGWPAPIRQAAQAAGFSRNTGCPFNVKSLCLWA